MLRAARGRWQARPGLVAAGRLYRKAERRFGSAKPDHPVTAVQATAWLLVLIEDLNCDLDQDYRLSTGCSVGELELFEAGVGLEV